jgi:hypothetical protein
MRTDKNIDGSIDRSIDRQHLHSLCHTVLCKGGITAITVKRHCRGGPMRDGVSGPLMGPSAVLSPAVAVLPNGSDWKCWQCRAHGDQKCLAVTGQGFFEPIGSAVAVIWQCCGRGWTNQRARNPLTHRTTAAVPFGSVLAVMAVLPPSHVYSYLRYEFTVYTPLNPKAS